MKGQLIEIALSDLKASRLLYEKKLYPQSFFYFQQSVEKGFKALGLIAEAVDTSSMKKEVGHSPLKIYRKIVDRELKDAKEGKKVFERNPNISEHAIFSHVNHDAHIKNMENELQMLDRLGNIDLLNIDHDELIDVLEHLEEVEETKFYPPKDKFKEKFKEHFNRYEDFLKKNNPKAAQEFQVEMAKEGALDKVIQYSILYARRSIEMVFVSKVFYFCSIVTYKHLETSRYGTDQSDPLKFYTKKLPIVKFQPDFLRLLEKAIKRLKRYSTKK